MRQTIIKLIVLVLLFSVKQTMAAKDSGTNQLIENVFLNDSSSLNGSKANAYNWHVLSLSIFSIMGAFGNILVCMTIRRDPALQTKTNYYLFSLAIADLAVCLIVIPFSIIQDFSGNGPLNRSQTGLDAFLIDMFFR